MGEIMKLTSIKKKIRGMKKKARKLSAWTEYYKQLDTEALIKYEKEYVKIWINPFYNLYQINSKTIGRKNPSYKFRKQVFNHLIEIYLAWEDKLKQMEEPYYLKIWLADPEFMDSQVVAAVGSEIEYYNNIFDKNKESKEFPFNTKHPLLDLFEWERCMNGYYMWESDLETLEEINEIRKKANKIHECLIDGKLEKSYFISTGDMWTGAIRKSGTIT
ncbi:hypothetical protein YSY43_07790 [Paenibacillus sp. YSY-4.3]